MKVLLRIHQRQRQLDILTWNWKFRDAMYIKLRYNLYVFKVYLAEELKPFDHAQQRELIE